VYLEEQSEFDLMKHIRRLERENQLRLELSTHIMKLKDLNDKLINRLMGPRARQFCINQIEEVLKETNAILHVME